MSIVPLRVLHFYKSAFPYAMGGVEQVIHQLARGASAYGVSSDVLSLDPRRGGATVSMDGYNVHRVKRNFEIASTGFSIAAFKRFSELSANADLIHYHYPWPFMDLVHFAMLRNKPTLVTYHSDIIRQRALLKFYAPLQKKFLNSVDKIVATSSNYLASSQVLEQFPDKVEVIPIGLDKSTYPQPSDFLLQQWRDMFGTQFFLFVGVFRYYKGLHILLDAAKDINCPIVLIGTGPTERDLKKQAADLGLTNVHFLGQLPDEDKAALLTLCLGVVFPSHLRSEAFGISLLEGAMFGKPMISSEIGTGTSFINIAGLTGVVVNPSDAKALGAAMRQLLENKSQADEMGRQAKHRYESHFTSERMVESYVSLYQELTATSRKRQSARIRTS